MVDEFELMWHEAERMRRARQYKEGLAHLDANKKFIDPNCDFYKNKNTAKLLPDYIGHWYWMRGRYLKNLGDPASQAEAEKCLLAAAKVKPYKEKYIVPHAYYDLADMLFTQGMRISPELPHHFT